MKFCLSLRSFKTDLFRELGGGRLDIIYINSTLLIEFKNLYFFSCYIKYFEADFKRNNDIFDILDFHDNNKKIICEVKGRRNTHDKYDTTIITTSKINEAYMKIEKGYRVYLIFVFTDKTMSIEITKDFSFPVKLTGSNQIEHYLIPIKDLQEIDENFLSS